MNVIDYEYGENNFLGFELANILNETLFDHSIKTFPFFNYTYEDLSPAAEDLAFYYLAFDIFL